MKSYRLTFSPSLSDRFATLLPAFLGCILLSSIELYTFLFETKLQTSILTLWLFHTFFLSFFLFFLWIFILGIKAPKISLTTEGILVSTRKLSRLVPWNLASLSEHWTGNFIVTDIEDRSWTSTVYPSWSGYDGLIESFHTPHAKLFLVQKDTSIEAISDPCDY